MVTTVTQVMDLLIIMAVNGRRLTETIPVMHAPASTMDRGGTAVVVLFAIALI